MYNQLLSTFLSVADCGSFSKASSVLYISKVSIMKQIDSLEHHFGFPLFIRSTRGLTLTSAGKYIYDESLKLIQYSTQCLAHAAELSRQEHTIASVTTSLFRTSRILSSFLQTHYPNTNVFFQEISDTTSSLHNTLDLLDQEADYMIGFENTIYVTNQQFFPISPCYFQIAVPKSSSLYSYPILSWKDLQYQTFCLPHPGISPFHDRLREYLKMNYPLIDLIECNDVYSSEKYNFCLKNGYLTDTLNIFDDIIPMFRSVPLSKTYILNYGIYYANDHHGLIKLLKSSELADMFLEKS